MSRMGIASSLLVAGMLAASLAAAQAKPATAPAPAAPPAARPAAKPLPRPLTLDAQTIEGKAESPRVLFVHMGPNIALEDAPKFPPYLRDDFTAALSSPVRLVVRPYPPLVWTPATGGNR